MAWGPDPRAGGESVLHAAAMAFTDWPLRPELLAGLHAAGFTDPTSVQDAAFPAVLRGKDLIVQSRTGTGKTLAFGLPILQRISPGPGPVEVLVVLPTRELAAQVALSVARLAQMVRVSLCTISGGASYREQLRALAGGARIVVGTPGRLVDHITRQGLDLTHCRTLVLDEADEMLDMGFADDLETITKALPADRQTLLFSATLPPETQALARKILREPESIAVSTGLSAAPEIHHAAYEVFREAKGDLLVQVLHVEDPALALVFCHTKAETEEVAERLRLEGFSVGYLHGDLAQTERNRTLAAFRRRQLRVLVATDVAARGIDVKGVSHVFNTGVPAQAETYVHRVGRTGRAGQSGTAITFVIPADLAKFRRLAARASIPLELRRIPQAEDVRVALSGRFRAEIDRSVGALDARMQQLGRELLADIPAEELVAALLQGHAGAIALFDAGRDIPVPRSRSAAPTRQQGPGGPRAQQQPQGPHPSGPMSGLDAGPGDGSGDAGAPRRLRDWQDPSMERIWLGIGRDHGLNPARLVAAVTQSAGVSREALGAIAIHPFFTFFDVHNDAAEHVLAVVRGFSWDGRPVRANPVPRVGSRPSGVAGPGPEAAGEAPYRGGQDRPRAGGKRHY